MAAETCAQMQTRLDGYIAARDGLAMGRQVVRQSNGDKDLQWGPGDAKRLDILIREVRIAMERARCAGCRPRGGMTYITPSG